MVRKAGYNELVYSGLEQAHPAEYWKYYIRKGKTYRGVTGQNTNDHGLWYGNNYKEWLAIPSYSGFAQGRAAEIWEGCSPGSFARYHGEKLKTNVPATLLYLAKQAGMTIKTPYRMKSSTNYLENWTYETNSKGEIIRDETCVPKMGAIAVFAQGMIWENKTSNKGKASVCEEVTGTESGVFSESVTGMSPGNLMTSYEYNPLCYARQNSAFYLNNNATVEDKKHRLSPSQYPSGYWFAGYIYPPNECGNIVLGNVSVLGSEDDVYVIPNGLWI